MGSRLEHMDEDNNTLSKMLVYLGLASTVEERANEKKKEYEC